MQVMTHQSSRLHQSIPVGNATAPDFVLGTPDAGPGGAAATTSRSRLCSDTADKCLLSSTRTPQTAFEIGS